MKTYEDGLIWLQSIREQRKEIRTENQDIYFNSTSLVNVFGISRYRALKIIHELEVNGIIEKTTCGGGCNDYGEPMSPWNGYVTTAKGMVVIKEMEG